MAIKKDDVFRVCDTMFADGVSPSLVAVRTALGSGSYSTISAYLTEWKSASRTAPVIGEHDAPEEVQEVFAVALRSMWAVAQSQAAAEFDVLKLEYVQKMSDVVFKEKEALDLCESLQAEIDLFTEKALVMQTSIEDKNGMLAQLRQSNAELRARHDEIRNQHASLLAKVRPISLRKDRGPVDLKPVKKA